MRRLENDPVIRNGDWKLVRYDKVADGGGSTNSKAEDAAANVTGTELYNQAKDIHEDNDLAKEMPEKVKELQTMCDEWNKLNIAAGGKDYGIDNDGDEPGVPPSKKPMKGQNQ